MKTAIIYGLSLACFLLTACQSPMPLQNTTPSGTGQLVFRFQWPGFRTQALLPETQYIVVAVYQGTFTEAATYRVIPAGQEQLRMEALPVGATQVLAVALNADQQVLNGDMDSTTILPQQRHPVLLDLQSGFLSQLSETEQQALLAWLPTILPVPQPMPRPSSSSNAMPIPTPSPEISPTPLPPVASESPQPQESASPQGVSSPSPFPTTGSRSSGDSSGGSSGGGGGNNVTTPTPTPSPEENENPNPLNTTVTLEDGSSRPETVVIQ